MVAVAPAFVVINIMVKLGYQKGVMAECNAAIVKDIQEFRASESK